MTTMSEACHEWGSPLRNPMMSHSSRLQALMAKTGACVGSPWVCASLSVQLYLLSLSPLSLSLSLFIAFWTVTSTKTLPFLAVFLSSRLLSPWQHCWQTPEGEVMWPYMVRNREVFFPLAWRHKPGETQASGYRRKGYIVQSTNALNTTHQRHTHTHPARARATPSVLVPISRSRLHCMTTIMWFTSGYGNSQVHIRALED